jgi:hypothetical protein
VGAAPRDRATRKKDALSLLATPGIDVWVATASADGAPYLVPLSLAWVDGRAVIALAGSSRTARNLHAGGPVRLAVGPTRDLVMIDAVVERRFDVAADPALGEAYVAQADWDPRGEADYEFLVLRPVRLQAWREVNEIPGRTLMADGGWVV